MSSQEGNYHELAESTFTNTYESVSAGVYSEVQKPLAKVGKWP